MRAPVPLESQRPEEVQEAALPRNCKKDPSNPCVELERSAGFMLSDSTIASLNGVHSFMSVKTMFKLKLGRKAPCCFDGFGGD